ncbi:MAG: amino acid adenylation domain-containing protein, partial [Bryobacteraceae bacterium]|nr:amino acid adenylation domain-containing protein [Bryobacteraceae bacterium]
APLSFAQQRLWFLDQLAPGSSFYNVPAAVPLRMPLNATLLERSLNEIIRRHEVLRTRFVTVDGQPVQVIAEALAVEVPLVDLRHFPEGERQAEATRLANVEARQPFDLTRGPLLRASLLRLQDSEYVFCLTVHHVVCDGWSMGLLFQELNQLYTAYALGRPSPLEELPVQYADYAMWQREALEGEVLEEQLEYWRKQLAGIVALELPADHARPATPSYRGGQVEVRLPRGLTGRLKALSQREGVTLFMTLLAAFQILLERYTGQEEVVVGSPIAGRNRAEIEPLIGFFVNTLVMRTRLEGNPGFREALHRVQEVALGAYAHQDLPFEMLVEKLQPERDLSRNPLFQVTFQLLNAPTVGSGVTAVRNEGGVEVTRGTSIFDLACNLVETGEEVWGGIEYSTDLFERWRIERMAEHYVALLEGIVEGPERRVWELPLLREWERRQMLVEWNATKAEVAGGSVIEQFEAQVERTPEAVAVCCGEERIGYGELNRRANQLGHRLRGLGVGPEEVVGVCAERSVEMVVGLLAVWKAGGAYVPLDPGYPEARLWYMREDAGIRILLTERSLAGRFTGEGLELVLLEDDGGTLPNLPHRILPHNLAYVIYTSGSTGMPKGIMIPHRGLMNYLSWCTRAYDVEAGSGAPVHSSISFDLTITGLFAPLLVGRSVELLPEGRVESLGTLLKSRSNFSLVKITPAHLAMLGQELRPEEAAGKTRAFIIGGSNLLAEHIKFWQESAPETVLINEYGPTETVVGCCVYRVPQEKHPSGAIPIGRPIANTRLYVLDAHMQPVPVGVAGELYIGGDGVARGYLRRPDLTAEKFVPDPFSDEPGQRLYRSGDLARYLPDGNLEYLGRIDQQVKIRGFRIEPTEVEIALKRHPGVLEACVVARDHGLAEKRLVAYFVPAGETAPSVTELRTSLQETLPEYMIPSVFLPVPELPLTANGKVDTRALPEPDAARPRIHTKYAPPRNEVEEKLVAIWKQVIGLERIGIHDNFFELGGDSILSIQVIARANQAGLHLTPQQLFLHQTISELAAVAGTSPAVEAEQGDVTGPSPLTPVQKWFFEQDLPEPHHYNQSVLIEVGPALNLKLLEMIAERLMAHHDALRLRFKREGSEWRQAGTPSGGPAPVSRIDLSGVAPGEQMAALAAKAAGLQASLNLAQGPIARFALFEFGGSRPNQLLILIHHLAVDGVSWRILLEDFQTAYMQLSRGESIAPGRKTTSIRQWAERLAERGRSSTLRDELEFWLHAQSDFSPLPLDHPSGENTVASTREVVVSLGREETRALLHEVPAAYRTQINDALLAALVDSFRRWTGRPSLLLDLEGHGRDALENVDVSRTVGWFTTIFPVLLNTGAMENPGELLKSIKEQLRRVPNRGIGYGLLRYAAGDEEIAARLRSLPQPEVIFNYLGQFAADPGDSRTAAPADAMGPVRSPRGRRRHLIEIVGSIASERLQLSWFYSENLHRRETIERLAEQFMEASRAIVAHCRTAEAGGFTPSDFARARVSQKDLDKLVGRLRQGGARKPV